MLLNFKDKGVKQDTVVKLLNKIKTENQTNQALQDGVDDILDIATGYCGAEMRVWE